MKVSMVHMHANYHGEPSVDLQYEDTGMSLQ